MSTQARYIPKGSMIVRMKDVDAVAYVSRFNSPKGARFHAVGYAGKAQKPTFNYIFQTAAHLSQYLSDWANGLKARAASKAERQAKRNAFQHTLKVGDILRTSWGYDQTNVEYFEVVKVVGKMVDVREIAQERVETGFDQGKCIPVPGKYIGEVERKKVLEGNCLKMSKWGRYAHFVEPKVICGAKVYGASSWTAYA